MFDNRNIVLDFWKKYLIDNQKILLTFVLIISVLVHGLNLFHYPYFEDDEGTYSSQAWSVLSLGKLTPYHYDYDHAPAGWILIAIWTFLTGGFLTFGFSLNSGRVLMILLNTLSGIFLYFIAKKFTGNNLLSALAVLVFSLSPLGIYFQRRILLDNIMVFWALASLCLLMVTLSKPKNLILSGLLFGIALVTKESAVFFFPAFIYLVYVKSKNKKIKSALIWLFSSFVPLLIYILYAISRQEFFPYGSVFGGLAPHTSLIGTLLQQSGRSNDTSTTYQTWLSMDPVILVIGAVASITNLILGIKRVPNRVVSFFSLFYGLYLLQSKLVFEFYILPILPFLSLNIIILVWYLVNRIKNSRLCNGILILLSLIMLMDFLYYGFHSKGQNLFTSNQTAPQITAVNWVLNQHYPDAFYVIDNYAYTELHLKQDEHFKYAEYYWKVEEDPSVYNTVLQNDWRNINFVAATPQLKNDVINNNLKYTGSAIKNSTLIQSFNQDGWSVDILSVNH
jgi:4-amino-4-deoxy-L-arabinose transferase-like glycosyltransferase